MDKYVPDDFVLLEKAYKIICGVEGELIDINIPFTEEELCILELLNKKRLLTEDLKLTDGVAPIPKELIEVESNLQGKEEISDAVRYKDNQQDMLLAMCNNKIYHLGLFHKLKSRFITLDKDQIIINHNFYADHLCEKIFSNDNIEFIVKNEDGLSEIKIGYVVVSYKHIEKYKDTILNELKKHSKTADFHPDHDIELGDPPISIDELAKKGDLTAKAIARVHYRYNELSLLPNMNDDRIWGIMLQDKPKHGAGRKWGETVFKLIKSGKYPSAFDRGFGPITTTLKQDVTSK